MSLVNPFSLVLYIVSIIAAMCLNVAAWPEMLADFNPDWVLLFLIYWTLAVPERVGIFNAWAIGLLTDVLTGRMLGQHALTYVLVVYLCLKLHKRLRQYPPLQQGLFILLCLLISRMLIFWLESGHYATVFRLPFWLPVFVGTLCWPLVFSVLRFFRFYRRPR
ncbi:MAG: rod shape-determining protein MreD [Gammaproteobacteria bacterium]